MRNLVIFFDVSNFIIRKYVENLARCDHLQCYTFTVSIHRIDGTNKLMEYAFSFTVLDIDPLVFVTKFD